MFSEKQDISNKGHSSCKSSGALVCNYVNDIMVSKHGMGLLTSESVDECFLLMFLYKTATN